MSISYAVRPCAHGQSFRVRIKRCVATFGMVISAVAFANDASLTLADAQRLAVARSRQLPAQDHAVRAARDMAAVAGQLPDPVLTIGVDNLPVNGPDRLSVSNDFMTMRRIGIMQEWTGAEKRQLRTERGEREAERILAAKSLTVANIERDTALAWFDCFYAEAMAALAAEQVTQARLEVDAAEGAYRAGRGSQSDALAARSSAVIAEDRQSETTVRVRNARTNLARWIGSAADRSLASGPDVEAIRLDPVLLTTQLAHHPQIGVLSRQEDIAQTDVKLAQANKKADWSFEVSFQQRGPAYSNMVSVGVSVPLQWNRKDRQDRELSAKLALVEQARADRDEILREHIAETRVIINEWQSNRQRITRYQRELIPLASDRILATVGGYRGNKNSLVDVLAARRHELDLRIQVLQLQWDTARLWSRINFLLPIELSNRIPDSHSILPLQKDRP